MSYFGSIGLIAAAIVAQPAFGQGPFGAPAVDDAALASTRGTYRPPSSLTISQLLRFQDDTARRDFALAGSVSSIEMDNWWATTGTTLILSSDAARAANLD